MNPELATQSQLPPPHQRRSLIVRICIAALGIMLASFFLVVLRSHVPTGTVTWLTPAELDQLSHPGKLTLLKWKLVNLAGPISHRLWNVHPGIHIKTTLLALPPNAPELASLPKPVATNFDGARAWILSPPDFDALQHRIQSLPGPSVLGAPSVVTSDEGSARVSMTSASSGGPVGLTVDITPKIIGKSVRLLVRVVSTVALVPADGGTSTIHTNFALNFQAWPSNRWGVIIDGGKVRDVNGDSFLFVIVPTLIDATGMQLK